MSLSADLQSIQATERDIQAIERETGRVEVQTEVLRWLNQNLDNVAFTAQVDLLRILGVKIL